MPWILHDEVEVGFWTYPPRPNRWWHRTTHYQEGLNLKARYRIFSVVRTWYDSDTRAFEKIEDVLLTQEQVLADGWAIYDWRERQMIYPERRAA